MASSVKKVIARVEAEERRRQQAARPTLFERQPSAVNRTAGRMTPPPLKGTRGARERKAIADSQ